MQQLAVGHGGERSWRDVGDPSTMKSVHFVRSGDALGSRGGGVEGEGFRGGGGSPGARQGQEDPEETPHRTNNGAEQLHRLASG